MTNPDCAGAISYALTRLEQEISAEFSYHNIIHTRDHVMPAAVMFAELSGCTAEEIAQIRVAAAFHDLGFTEDHTNHEIAGLRVAAQVLPDFGFEPRAIELIMGCILATRLPQSPRSLLEMIVADADLDVLGRDDFFGRNAALRRELAAIGKPMSDAAWYGSQLAFIENHTYFTAAAHQLRDAGKQANAAELRARLATADTGNWT